MEGKRLSSDLRRKKKKKANKQHVRKFRSDSKAERKSARISAWAEIMTRPIVLGKKFGAKTNNFTFGPPLEMPYLFLHHARILSK